MTNPTKNMYIVTIVTSYRPLIHYQDVSISYPLVIHVNFSQQLYNIDEYDGQVQVMLILSNLSTADVTITVFSNDGSATGKSVIC